MLEIIIPVADLWDEKNCRFISTQEEVLHLEHSLVSISKWESKWHKVFLTKEPKTYEETIDYIRCMTLDDCVPLSVYERLTNGNIKDINEYIDDPMTASSVKEEQSRGSIREQITSELIYYWMISYNIPIECQYWHLNRLLMLIRICNAKNKPPKKRSKNELYRHFSETNAINKRRFNSTG